MFDDPERYEHDGFYEENTDYEDEYETDDSDYIVDAEEDENPFGTMRKKLLTIFPKRSGRTKLFLLTMIRITSHVPDCKRRTAHRRTGSRRRGTSL